MQRIAAVGLCFVLAGCDAKDEDPAADDAGATTTDDGGDDGSTSGSAEDTGADGDGSGATDGGSGDDSTGGTPSGCGSDPGITGMMTGQAEVAGEVRRFILSMPDDYDPDRAYPLVFGFHGRGSNAEQFVGYNGVESAAADQAIFVYPEGVPQAAQGGVTGWELTPNGADMQFFDALLTELSANLCIDPERVFATGHSHGGFFSNALGCARGDVLRAIGPVAAGGPGAACEGQVAAWMAHNPDDNVVPIALGKIVRDQWLQANHCSEETMPVEPAPCVQYVGCDAGYEVVWCEHDETLGIGPHTWPGFAGDAIWAFFAAY